MRQYLDLLSQVYHHGEDTASRAVLKSDGSRPRTRSLFGLQARYDLADGFPLVTTKKIWFKGVVAELLWMLSGSSNVKPLQEQGVHIWDEWADADGELGPVYGSAWRHWSCGDGTEVDQIACLLADLHYVARNPEHVAARRMILTAWNPVSRYADTKAPLGCHTMAQFSVRPPKASDPVGADGRPAPGRLSCCLYQRSADLFLGVPWNAACYSLLTHLLARITGLQVGEFIHSIGDGHIYSNHFDQVAEQLTREPQPLPKLVIADGVKRLDDVKVDSVWLEGYESWPGLKGEVAV